jgi:hypothetical protein
LNINGSYADAASDSNNSPTSLEITASAPLIVETNFYKLSQVNFQAFSNDLSLIMGISTNANFWVAVREKKELHIGQIRENVLQLKLVKKFTNFVETDNNDNSILSILQIGKVLYVAMWNGSNSDNNCGGITIHKYPVFSSFDLGKGELIFTSTPCLTGTGTGAFAAQMASDGRSLFFAAGNRIHSWQNGNFPYEGFSNLAKMSTPPPTNVFGKILKINLNTNAITPISKGLRNPNGLFYSKQFLKMFHTDNGARGGDGLYESSQGSDFGWPKVSLGLPYGRDTGQNFTVNSLAYYTPPLFGWTPSISPSQIVQVEKSNVFGKYWNSDLLIGSLKDASLHRIRVSKLKQGLRVLYDERIKIQNHRLRSIVQLSGTTGGILLSTDDGQLILLHNPSEDVVYITPQQP